MKFLKAIRLDDSDARIFALIGAAEDGEWCVTGGHAVCDLAAGGCGRVGCSVNEDGSPKAPACASSFIGVSSHGRSTLAEVAEIDAATYASLVEALVRHFVEHLGAPSEAAARRVAEEECAYTRDLAEGFPPNVWITVSREPTEEGVGERYRVFERLMIGSHKL